MKKLLLTTSILILGLLSLEAQSDPYARDLLKICEYFEGEFDNDSQLWFQGRRGWSGNEEDKHIRIHAIHTRIEAPDIGQNVFYVEEYIDNNPDSIIRQRIVNFRSDLYMDGIAMDLYFLQNAKRYRGAHLAGNLLDSLSKSNLFQLEGCGVIFKREADQFFGQMQDKACQFGKVDKRRYSVHDIHLSPNKYWRIDQTYLVSNDKLHSGHASEVPFKMRKAQSYRCNVSFTEKGYYDPSGNDKKYEDVIIHNQGGSETFYNPIKDKTYILQLREKEYPYYSEGSDFFMLRFIEENATRSEVIVTSEPNINKISFSLGWSSAACYKN